MYLCKLKQIVDVCIMYQDEIITLRSKLSEAQALLAKTAEERDKALQQLKEYEEKIRKAEKASHMKSL